MSGKESSSHSEGASETGIPAKKVCLEDDLKSDSRKGEDRSEKAEKDDDPDDGGENTTSGEDKLKLQQQESTRRENVLVMRLATKEQEMQDLLAQIHELKQAQTPSTSQLRSTLIDPAVNLLFETMKNELEESNKKLEQAQNDLNAWKFTPDSVTGKKLMAKCRMLFQENQDLGKQLSQGRVAQLEAELALQRKYGEELKSSQDEMNEFVIQLDEEVEGLQSTIYALQQELKETKQTLTEARTAGEQLETQVAALRSASVPPDDSRRDSVDAAPCSDQTMEPCVAVEDVEVTATQSPDAVAVLEPPDAVAVSEPPDAVVATTETPDTQPPNTMSPDAPSPIESEETQSSDVLKVSDTASSDHDVTNSHQTAGPISPVYMASSFSISTLLSPPKIRTSQSLEETPPGDAEVVNTEPAGAGPVETPAVDAVIETAEVQPKPSAPEQEVDVDETSCNGEAAYDEQLSPTV